MQLASLRPDPHNTDRAAEKKSIHSCAYHPRSCQEHRRWQQRRSQGRCAREHLCTLCHGKQPSCGSLRYGKRTSQAHPSLDCGTHCIEQAVVPRALSRAGRLRPRSFASAEIRKVGLAVRRATGRYTSPCCRFRARSCHGQNFRTRKTRRIAKYASAQHASCSRPGCVGTENGSSARHVGARVVVRLTHSLDPTGALSPVPWSLATLAAGRWWLDLFMGYNSR
jgi:hypothetical protein